MKRTILTIVSTLFLITNLFSQNRVWVTIPNPDNIKTLSLNSTIISVEKAFPSSRTRSLQDVYEIITSLPSEDLITELNKNKSEFINPEIGPNYQTLDLPNDYNVSFTNQWSLELINASETWDIVKGSPSVKIAITDANYYLTHEELVGKYDYVSPNNTSTNYSHGTAVSIIAAGNTNNSVGTSSIGYNSRLELRVMNYNELLNSTYSGAKVINASWAAGCGFSTYGQQVVDEVYNNGSIIVASAGNGTTCAGSSNLVYPASYDHVISVTSVGPYDNHERTIGNPSTTHQHNNMVDICAPGYDVPLSVAPGTYTTGNGSSFASPFVSGTIALMLSVNPCLSVDDIEYILKETADTNVYNVNPQYVGQLGSGRLNSFLAVSMAKNFSTLNASIESDVNCTNGQKQLLVNNLNGVYPYTYLWNNTDTTNYFNVDENGTFAVEVADSNGCKFVDSIYVEKYTQMDDFTIVQNISCYGSNDGSIEVFVTGGYNVGDIIWDNGNEGSTLNNLNENIYTFQVVDGYGCTLIDSIRVSQPNMMVSTFNMVNPTLTSNGSIDITINGGTSPYFFEWNNNQTTEDLNDISEGFYEVLITDNNGCMSSLNMMLETDNTSSINELTDDKLILYPNPSNGEITIKTNSNIGSDLVVSNVNGQIIKSEKMFNGELSLINLSTGIYIVTLGNESHKVIVK